jgi:hypothetical protein
MSLCAYHRDYLAARTLPELTRLVKAEWGFDLRQLEGDPHRLASMDFLQGGQRMAFIQVAPCPYGFLAVIESQERLTGYSEDRDYADGVDYDNWIKMQDALRKLKNQALK